MEGEDFNIARPGSRNKAEILLKKICNISMTDIQESV